MLAIEARGFRKIDEFECQAMCGTSAAEQCFIALDDPNTDVFTVFADDTPVALFGASPYCEMGTPPGTCVLWFLGSDGLYNIKHDFMKQVRHWLDWLQRYHPIGFNLVSTDNEVSLKWAVAVGFTIHETEQRGRGGEHFTMILRQLQKQE